MRTAKRMLNEARRALLAAAALSAVSAVLLLALPLYAFLLVEAGDLSGGLEARLLTAGLAAGALIAALVMIAARDLVLVRAGVWLSHWLGQHVLDNGLRRAIPAEELRRQAEAGEAVGDMLAGPAARALTSCIAVPIFLAPLGAISTLLLLVAAVGAGLMVLAMARLGTSGSGRAHSAATSFGEAALLRASTIPGLAQSAGVQWERHNRHRVALRYADASRTARRWSLVVSIGVLTLVAGAGTAAWLQASGATTSGQTAAAIMLTAMALGALLRFAAEMPALLNARQAWRTIEALPPQAALLKCATGRVAVPQGALVLEGVSVVHDGRSTPSLDGIDLTCRSGECIAVTGAAGSGKSTLAAVAAGALQPTQGTVTIDGIAVTTWQRAPEAAPVGYYSDDPHLVAGSVRQNIAGFASNDAGTAEDAAAQAGVGALLMALPKGFDTQVGSGGEGLSCRERRAVALARACYGARAFIVLDEPEHGLDAVLLQAFEEVLLGLVAGGTGVIMITRNPALIDLADRVVALDGGRAHDVARWHRPVRRGPAADAAVAAA